MSQQLHLWQPTQVNLYDLFNESMVEELKHSSNDNTYPEEIHRALQKQQSRQPIKQSKGNVSQLRVLNRSHRQSDTLSSSHPKPIHDRGSNVISLF